MTKTEQKLWLALLHALPLKNPTIRIVVCTVIYTLAGHWTHKVNVTLCQPEQQCFTQAVPIRTHGGT